MTRHIFAQARLAITLCLVIIPATPVFAAESDALAISSNIHERHMPVGTVLDPIFASQTSDEIVSYTRGGDSAIWTGHYLAAEAFRYKVTASPDALASVRQALAGIHSLRVITGTDLLARCLVPTDWGFASAITREEAANGIFNESLNGRQYSWVGNTSRDQYSGVFFGLGVAYDMVDQPDVQAAISTEVSALLNFLIDHQWAVVMPNGSVSTVFWGRPDQQLSFLQVGRRVNPAQFGAAYTSFRQQFASLVITPIGIEALDDHDSYFKFNLDEINLYNLIRLEDVKSFTKKYMKAYKILRRTIDDHLNAHFDVIEHALRGGSPDLDSGIKAELDAWLLRPRRDPTVNWTSVYQACGTNRACHPIPVERRVPTDFLWQRSPFDLSGGGAGTIEGAGIDYILPYWMARYYQVF